MEIFSNGNEAFRILCIVCELPPPLPEHNGKRCAICQLLGTLITSIKLGAVLYAQWEGGLRED